MAFTMITVTGAFVGQDGTPSVGTVSFTLSQTMRDTAANQVREPSTKTVLLDNNGKISVTLAANDDPTTQPAGAYYTVREDFVGQPVRVYPVTVSSTATGGTVDLAELSP